MIAEQENLPGINEKNVCIVCSLVKNMSATIIQERKSLGLHGHASTSTAKKNIHRKKLMLCFC